MASKTYVLVDSDANTDTVEVDDVVLYKGGDPVALTDDQAQRVRDAGSNIRKHEGAGQSADPPKS